MHSIRSFKGVVPLAIVVAWVAAAPARAQTTDDGRRWEVEGYGGLFVPTGGSVEGAPVLPLPGPPIATSSPIFPSRRVPSWFFGDGALLLNQVNGQFGVDALITPLDSALGGSALSTGSGLAAGARVRRALSDRFAIEASFDFFPSASDLSDDVVAAAETTRASFVPAFQGLLATGPFTDIDVSSSSSRGGSALEIAATGALVWRLGTSGGFDPYLTLGGGVISGAGDGAALTLEGHYAFRVLGEVPIDETDRLTVRVSSRTVFAGLVGAGLRRALSERWGIRIDGRVLIGPRTTQVLLDTEPLIAQGTPADFVESFTAPSIQFSNNAATGRESSLGGPGLQGFETFAQDGLQARVLITAGVFFRF